MSSLHTEHVGVPVRDRAAQLRAGLGAFLFAISGAAMIWLSVLYVKRDVSASGPLADRLYAEHIFLAEDASTSPTEAAPTPTESPPEAALAP